MSLYPVHDFAPQTAWPCAFAGQCGQIDDDFDRATDQMAMRRAMIPLTDFQPVSVLRRIPPIWDFRLLPLRLSRLTCQPLGDSCGAIRVYPIASYAG